MYEDFIPERLAKLRTQKGVSARDMSLSLGQANNYINNIENKKTLPAMQSFFYICEYLGVTPQEFFDEGNPYLEGIYSGGQTAGRKINGLYPRYHEGIEQQKIGAVNATQL